MADIKTTSENKNWCACKLDTGMFSKRCYFKDGYSTKPVYMFGIGAGVVNKSHKECDKSTDHDKKVKDSFGGEKMIHSIVHDTVQISPERFENTFEKLFRGAMEMNTEETNCIEGVEKNFTNSIERDSRKPIQHPARVFENSQSKGRIKAAMGGVENEIEKLGENDISTSPDKNRENINSTTFIDRKRSNVIPRNRRESSFWKTCFRAQRVESGTLLNTHPYNNHSNNLGTPLICEQKPYNTQSTPYIAEESPETVLEKWKKSSLNRGLSGDGWTIMGRNPPDNLKTLSGKQSVDTVVDHNESNTGKLLRELETARFIAENAQKLKPYGEQGLKRSECSWYRKIKSS